MDARLIAAIAGVAPWDLTDVSAGRALDRELGAQFSAADIPGLDPAAVTITDSEIPADADEPSIRIRAYRPASGTTEPLGALVMFHGGAFCLGDLETEHYRCLLYCQRSQIVVVNVEYRLAPEHRFPAAPSDCYRALAWVSAHAGELGIAPERIGVAGVSAGGALAAAVALMARDRSGPAIAAQLLLYPVTDHRLKSGSMRAGHDAPAWQTRPSEQMWAHYLDGSPEPISAYAAPIMAEHCRGLPPAFVAVADQDPLRDEALEYSLRLLADAVVVELHLYPETYHVFDLAAPSAPISQQALADQIGFLSSRLATPPTPE